MNVDTDANAIRHRVSVENCHILLLVQFSRDLSDICLLLPEDRVSAIYQNVYNVTLYSSRTRDNDSKLSIRSVSFNRAGLSGGRAYFDSLHRQSLSGRATDRRGFMTD